MKKSIRLKELKPNMERIYIPDSSYINKRPKLDPDEVFQVKTDSEGNQLSAYGNSSPNRIYFIGGSTVESIYSRQSCRPHSILEKRLIESGYNYEVLNLGVSGAQLINVANLLISKLAKDPGQTILLALPANDAACLQFEDEYWSNHKSYATLLPADGKNIAYTQAINLKTYSRALRLIKSICRIYDFKLIMVSSAYSGVNESLESLNKYAKNFCDESNIPFINIESDVREKSDIFYDDLHFLSDGCVFYAGLILEKLKKHLHQEPVKTVEVLEFLKNKILKDISYETDVIDLNGVESAAIFIDFKKINDIDKPLLFSVDYNPPPREGDLRNLILSNNIKIGYYRYISKGMLGKRVEISYEVEIPPDCTDITLKIFPWGGGETYIYSCRAIVIRNKGPRKTSHYSPDEL